MEEVWKDIEGFPGYQVSNQGRVRSWFNNKYGIGSEYHILKQGLGKVGYYTVSLRGISKNVHQLVAEAFIGKSQKGMTVNHKDGDKQNNNVTNLEIITRRENNVHAYENGLNPHRKPVRIIETGETFESLQDCAEAIDGEKSNICHCLTGKLKSHKGLHFEEISKDDYKKHSKQENKPFLYPFQMDAIKRMFNGCILNGKVGSGKSRTGLFYYFKEQGGWIDENGYKPMRVKPRPKDLIIITTAKKRNTGEWTGELSHFLLSPDENQTKRYGNKIIVDSWNNIQKYVDITDSFFIFDEHHAQGWGTWSKSFLKIAKNNEWIILSATAGDTYMDYCPVFLAHNFYRNKTEFCREHIIYARYSKYPKIERYINTGRLNAYRNRLLIDMDFKRKTVQHREDVYVRYDTSKYRDVTRTRWNPYTDEPIEQASGLCYVLRRVVNEDVSRQVALLELYEKHPKMIVFYSFDYERDILLNLAYGNDVKVAQYNGHVHDPLPEGDKWVYIVNYNACEGWNAITTDTIVFYSQTYSYKTLVQAEGRIDRLTTPFTDLYYYNLKSRSGIDLAISKALSEKKNFNEGKWAKW